MEKKKSIVFFHPDLGIGGAERLVVDAAVGLQNRGHTVTIFTSHCDPKHSFDEARNGTLDVRVRGQYLVPPNLFGRFAILGAILRQLHLLAQVWYNGELAALKPDVYFVDQLSAGIPVLRMMFPDIRILFYCHFPDKLLASRQSFAKELYRLPFDWLEAWTTGAADSLVVNSTFTSQVFAQAFPGLRERTPTVVYPCVNAQAAPPTDGPTLWDGKRVILSINRFERKKGITLALEAFARLRPEQRAGSRLVIAGGYDPRVAENVAYHRELYRLAETRGLTAATTQTVVSALNIPADIEVLFLLSVPASLKAMLLHGARLLVYTPANEHFGIVPLEAMLAGTPVLAADSGGPLETVVDGRTGWLRPVDDVAAWAEIMGRALDPASDGLLRHMGEVGRRRVQDEFSAELMAQRLDEEIDRMQSRPRPVNFIGGETLFMAFFVAGISIFLGSQIQKHHYFWH
ncbi:MAG: Alpha-1,3-mannosyltransferase-like protein [Thelocarpon superellum]|nr:MAG: Alpha-1,3-mannosyltransferase-like protein [Thelocarpon superellum]